MKEAVTVNIVLKRPQGTVYSCEQRFRVLVAGRRFGKTYLALIELIRAASAPGRVAWYVAPTYRQAKRVAWKALKAMTKHCQAKPPNETDLTIELTSGGTISLRGADNYDSLRGDGLDFVVLDEYASMAPEAWTEVLRPALADRRGRALFIGTPRGHNHFFTLFDWVENQPDWERFQFTTEQGGNVTLEELESATHEMDERTYRQEFQASFENLGVGLAYYAFDRRAQMRNITYNRNYPIWWAIDFNVNPMCSVIGQTINGVVCVLDVLVMHHSNTLAHCEEFLARTEKWIAPREIPDDLPGVDQDLLQNAGVIERPMPLLVYVYGDASADSDKTSASRTDWEIVKRFFGRYTDRFRAHFRVPSKNGPVKDRVNCVNTMLLNFAGERHLYLSPNCRELVADFEQLGWKADPHGRSLSELDKSDPMRSHLSDALGYYIVREFPMRAKSGERSGPALF